FDEADALFGKRSEVSDSHDRYANIEVAYLLQKMEGYAGAVILATNFRRNIDDAFVRRLDFVIDFPFPEADDRRRIWELLLPAEAALAGGIGLAFPAEGVRARGGGERSCCCRPRRRWRRTSTSTSSPSASSCPAARSATARCRRRSRRPT